MRIFRIIGLAALLMVGASSASAQVYYDMMELSGQSGYQSTIYETVTTADFLRAPANGVQRLAFTRGSAFTATVTLAKQRSLPILLQRERVRRSPLCLRLTQALKLQPGACG